MMKKVNVSVKEHRAMFPFQSAMNDPSSITAYKSQKALTDQQVEAVAAATQRVTQQTSALRQRSTDVGIGYVAAAASSADRPRAANSRMSERMASAISSRPP